MGDNDPKTIKIDGNDSVNEEGIITVYIKGQRFLVTPTEGLSVINQLSGVLLAYGYSRGHGQGQKKYT